MTLRDLGEHFRDKRVNSPAVQRQVDAAKQLFNERTPDMTLRDELESAIDLHGRIASNWGWEDAYNQACARLIRDHGQALLKAVDRASAYVVVTRDGSGEIVAVTRQDDDGRVLEVLAEKYTPEQRHAHAEEVFLTSQAIDRARGGGE